MLTVINTVYGNFSMQLDNQNVLHAPDPRIKYFEYYEYKFLSYTNSNKYKRKIYFYTTGVQMVSNHLKVKILR